MENKSLYQISKEYADLAELLIDGELTPELESQLQVTQSELQAKAINYGFVVKQLDNEAAIIDMEIKRLQSLKQARTNGSDRLKNILSNAMNYFGVEKIETPLIKISFRKSESVEVDEEELDSEYMNEKTVLTPDKKAIKEAIKQGLEVTGARLITNQNIQIT